MSLYSIKIHIQEYKHELQLKKTTHLTIDNFFRFLEDLHGSYKFVSNKLIHSEWQNIFDF